MGQNDKMIRIVQVTGYMGYHAAMEWAGHTTTFVPYFLESIVRNGRGRVRKRFAIIRLLRRGEVGFRGERRIEKKAIIRYVYNKQLYELNNRKE